MQRTGLADFSFTLQEGGGSYTAQSAATPSANRYSVTAPSGPAQTVQPFQLLPEHYAHLLDLLDQTHGLKGCASRAKGIADMGSKTLIWRKPSGETVTCTYNFSESKPVVELTAIFQAMAFTLDQGRKLEQLHRFDRLGLDEETILLTTAAKEGQAQAIETIAPTLQSLVNDPDVLERVRNRAAKLLAEKGATP